MRFWLRWIANGIAIFLGLYLVDSLLHERFHFAATWAVVVAAIVLGLPEQLRQAAPPRPRQAAPGAHLAVVVTVLVNALILQIFVWVGADLTTRASSGCLLAGGVRHPDRGAHQLAGGLRPAKRRPRAESCRGSRPAAGSGGSRTGESRRAASLDRHGHLVPVRLHEQPEVVRAAGHQLGVRRARPGPVSNRSSRLWSNVCMP